MRDGPRDWGLIYWGINNEADEDSAMGDQRAGQQFQPNRPQISHGALKAGAKQKQEF